MSAPRWRMIAFFMRWWKRWWQYLRRDAGKDAAAAYPMTAREYEALKGIARGGGTASAAWIAVRLGVSPEYVRMLCAALVRDDLVDVTPKGRYTLTPRGKRALYERGVLTRWHPEELELLPPDVRKKLARELADEIKKEVGGAIGSLVGERSRERSAATGKEGVTIRTDYTFPAEVVALEHTLGDRAEREVTTRADRIDEATRTLEEVSRRNA